MYFMQTNAIKLNLQTRLPLGILTTYNLFTVVLFIKEQRILVNISASVVSRKKFRIKFVCTFVVYYNRKYCKMCARLLICTISAFFLVALVAVNQANAVSYMIH